MANEDKSALRTLASAIISRMQFSQFLGSQFGGKRDLYGVFGYPKVLTIQDLFAKYERQDVASRIVSMPAGATWNNPPTVEASNPDFSGRWEALIKKHKLWNVMLRADKLSSMGRFSVLFLGFDGGKALDVPVTPSNNRRLLYIKPLSEASVTVEEFDKDPTSERYGLPLFYKIELAKQLTSTIEGAGASSIGSKKVHYTRIVHIAQDPLEDTVYGIPILERVYNLLEDLLKVAGGTAEGYWLNGRRGMQADIDKEMELDAEDAEALSDMLDEYQHDLRRIIKTRGVDLKDLGATVSDPRGTFEVVTALISGATGIPQRILVGSEAGQLASEQDRANWADRIDERRKEFAMPIMLEPLIERLVAVGLLPDPGEYEIKWPDAFRLSPLERAQTMAQQARAINNLIKQYDGKHLPVTTVKESREIVGYEGDLPEDMSDLLDQLSGSSDDPTNPGNEEEEEADMDEQDRREEEAARAREEGTGDTGSEGG